MNSKDQELQFLITVCSRCERHTEVCPILKKPCIDPSTLNSSLAKRITEQLIEMWQRLLLDDFRRTDEEKRRPKK